LAGTRRAMRSARADGARMIVHASLPSYMPSSAALAWRSRSAAARARMESDVPGLPQGPRSDHRSLGRLRTTCAWVACLQPWCRRVAPR
jgi:hypothetical protein